jgi:hypothetical protein
MLEYEPLKNNTNIEFQITNIVEQNLKEYYLKKKDKINYSEFSEINYSEFSEINYSELIDMLKEIDNLFLINNININLQFYYLQQQIILIRNKQYELLYKTELLNPLLNTIIYNIYQLLLNLISNNINRNIYETEIYLLLKEYNYLEYNIYIYTQLKQYLFKIENLLEKHSIKIQQCIIINKQLQVQPGMCLAQPWLYMNLNHNIYLFNYIYD